MPPSTPATIASSEDGHSSVGPLRQVAADAPRKPWKRVLGSFLLMVGIYWCYALAVVPFIEPTTELPPDLDDSGPGLAPLHNVVDQQRQRLLPWFSPGDWELTSPKVFESPRGKLLLHEYKSLPDGRLEIKPCTMILLTGSETDSVEERNRKAVILQAPQGAILRFDTPIDMKQMKIGKLVGGEMIGPITIRSDQRLPGPQDDLLITTRDAELVGDRIITPHLVNFQLGPNRGSGRDLEIQLAPATTARPNSPAPGFAGVNSLALKKDVRMRLHPGGADLFPGSAAAPIPQPAAADNRADTDLPVEITCDGAFQFDVTRHAATFQKHVDVSRVNPEGTSDQLTCEVLSVFFEPVSNSAPADVSVAAPRSGFPKLEPSRIEAEGDPVIIRSPSRGIQARGTRLEYDLKKTAGLLRGPGWLHAARPGNAQAQPIVAAWQRILEFGPFEGSQRARLAGDAQVESAGTGALRAETILLFLHEEADTSRPDAKRPRLVPDRLQAYERVHFESPTLSGDVNHLQVWIKRLPPPANLPAQVAATTVAQPPAVAAAASPAAGEELPAPPGQHMHAAGNLLQIEALLGEKTADVTRIHLEGDVEVRETRTADSDARPLVMKGDQVDVEQPAPQQAIVHIVGRPAHIEAREMSIDGAEIQLDRARNNAWVNGQGLMTLLVPGDVANQPAAEPRPLEITWKGRMDFDGRDAIFQDGVVALMQQRRLAPTGQFSEEHQRLTSDRLQAVFEPSINFMQTSARTRPQISHILCRGNVFLEQRTTQADRPTSLDRMKVVDLNVEPTTGNLLAHGPGWVRRVWVDTGTGLPGLPGAAAPPPVAAAVPGVERLAYLGVYFQDHLAGNQTRQTMDFHDRVRCVYGPVADWDTILDPDDPEKLGVGGALLTSDRLQVLRTAATGGRQQPFELSASGNARLEGRGGMPGTPAVAAGAAPNKTAGQMYSASAARLTYVAAKDLLVLEGDGRNYAYLARQTRVGAPYDEQSAGKFMFWPSLNQLQIQDAHGLNIQNFDSGAPPRRPPSSAAAPTRVPR